MECEVGEAVVEQEEIGGGGKPFEGFSPCGPAVGADHHRHSEAEVAEVAARATADSATVLTTEKDAVKIDAVRHGLGVLRIELRFVGPEPAPSEVGLA